MTIHDFGKKVATDRAKDLHDLYITLENAKSELRHAKDKAHEGSRKAYLKYTIDHLTKLIKSYKNQYTEICDRCNAGESPGTVLSEAENNYDSPPSLMEYDQEGHPLHVTETIGG